MTFGRLLLRSLFYHWRGNLAVFLGVAVGTAVLTGALLVGDSLRVSLRDHTLGRLGWIHHVHVPGRFFLPLSLGHAPVFGPECDQETEALVLQGSASTVPDSPADKTPRHRVRKIAILGVTDSFWLEGRWSPTDPRPVGNDFWNSAVDEVVLNATLAKELGVQPGEMIALHVQKASAVPRETLLGRREAGDVVDELRLQVTAVLPDDSFGGRFSLSPSSAAPRNAFVPLRTLQTRLDLDRRVNAVFVGADVKYLQRSFPRHLRLEHWGLVVHEPDSRTRDLFAKLDRDKDGALQRKEWQGRVAESLVEAADRDRDGELTNAEVLIFYRKHHPYLSLESRQMFLEPGVAEAALQAAKETGLRAAPTLVYLANTIAHGKEEMPYAIVAALDPGLPPPLGPFLPPGVDRLPDDGIVLADWKESPLHAEPGASIDLTYFRPEAGGRLREATASFKLAGFIPLEGAALDPDLTPEFPGITDKLDVRDWNPPFPYDNKRIQKRDEDYWKKYRTTPKAYVTLATGERLWGSRFGRLTSIRLAPTKEGDLSKLALDFYWKLLVRLQSGPGGFKFEPVRAHGLEASAGGTDFSLLFLSFSFFLIVSALLLVGLLFRLNLDLRAGEIGVLFASGFRPGTVRRLLLAEGALLAASGAILGCGLAVLFAWLQLELLRSWWPSSLERSLLRLHLSPSSFAIGYSAALAVSLATIVWAVRSLGKCAPAALLRGAGVHGFENVGGFSRIILRLSAIVSLLAFLGAIGCFFAAGRTRDHELQAVTFFASGGLLLIAGLSAIWLWMGTAEFSLTTIVQGTHSPLTSHHSPLTTVAQGTHVPRSGANDRSPLTTHYSPLTKLGCRNATRQPVRALLTTGLLASASFLIVAVDSFRRQPEQDFLEKNAGSGGFPLVAESDLPIFQDPNSEQGRDQLNFADNVRAGLRDVTIYPLRLRGGDDASCLNLYQPRQPRLLGVPRTVLERGGFRFQDSEAISSQERKNPWRLLEEARDDGAVPVIGEANTVAWMLKSGLGENIKVRNERGEEVPLRVVGLLKDSVFQGELLMSEDNFLRLYPNHEGYHYYLIEAPAGRAEEVKTLLDGALAEFGFEATATPKRLAEYLAVENMYLSTFQALGGLGLLLGALGLAVVLLRNVWERRGELALLRALGYRHAALAWLVLAENGFLLALGLGLGTVSALAAVAPHLLQRTGDVSVWRLFGFVALVLAVGLAAGSTAVAASLRAPLLPALRRE